MESWLQGTAITHQRPGQPASLCALRSPPVPGHRPLALDCSPPPPPHCPTLPKSRAGAEEGLRIVCGQRTATHTAGGEGVTRAGFLEEGKREEGMVPS